MDGFETSTSLLQCTLEGEQTEAGSQGGAPWDASSDYPAETAAAEPSTSSASPGASRVQALEASAVPEEAEIGADPVGWCVLPHCAAPCGSWEELIDHWRTTHPEEKSSVCHLCMCALRPGEEPRHLDEHSATRDRSCPRCSARFATGFLFLFHQRRFHRVQGIPAGGWCTQDGCPRSFASWEEFYEHYCLEHRVPNSRPWQTCRSCLAPCADAAAAQRHAEEHLREEGHDCSLCSAGFLDRGGRDAHMLDFHQMHGARPARGSRGERRAC